MFNKSNGKDNSARSKQGGVSYMLLTRVGNRIDSNRLRLRPTPSPKYGHRFGFVVVLSEPWPQATLVEESGSREAAIRTSAPGMGAEEEVTR